VAKKISYLTCPL